MGIAVSVEVMVAILRKRLGRQASLYPMPRILRVTLFEKTPIPRALEASDSPDDPDENSHQLILFDL
jgi:hypothetical protein